jgi:hypothetical protein
LALLSDAVNTIHRLLVARRIPIIV